MFNWIKTPKWFNDLNSDTLLKVLWVLLTFGVVFGATVFFIYFINFDTKLSYKQEVWGQFGDFIGGTLNPIFAFLSFLALLLTIVIQNRELKNSTDELRKTTIAAEKQSTYRESEAKRTDLYRLINKLSNRINKNYNESRLDDNYSLHAVLTERNDISPKLSTSQFYLFAENKESKTYKTLRWIEKDLFYLMGYLEKYKKVSIDSETPISDFYIHEFEEMVCFFKDYSLVDSQVADYYCTA